MTIFHKLHDYVYGNFQSQHQQEQESQECLSDCFRVASYKVATQKSLAI